MHLVIFLKMNTRPRLTWAAVSINTCTLLFYIPDRKYVDIATYVWTKSSLFFLWGLLNRSKQSHEYLYDIFCKLEELTQLTTLLDADTSVCACVLDPVSLKQISTSEFSQVLDIVSNLQFQVIWLVDIWVEQWSEEKLKLRFFFKPTTVLYSF